MSDAPTLFLYCRTGLRLALGGLCCVLLMAGASAAGIAVVYPDMAEPARSVFAKILSGIEAQAGKLPSYQVGSGFNAQDFAAEIRRQEVKVVIALGRNGLKAAAGLDPAVRLVVGGVVSAPPEADARGAAVYSLAPDPALLFQRLKRFIPAARRVFVVYDPRQNDWLFRQAQDKARSQGLELVGREAADLRGAVQHYQAILAGADGKTDSLWLMQDSTTVDEATVLPLVLQEAWERSLPFFSSSVAHVKRGALFSLFPNNVELGRSLAQNAQAGIGTAVRAGVVPLKEVLVAVNVRTAGHLGIQLDAKQQFDLVFPEP
ncbi:ABC transporter substrate-binding protein [Chitinimonas lacunae]|uniref:ABC transporter substrate-binding protein n=1 Tax=Chitinimonas lacunae TaxID=1963018 RepID=A0ABV8MQX4_9NEIS